MVCVQKRSRVVVGSRNIVGRKTGHDDYVNGYD
jgi:hypothetical protein